MSLNQQHELVWVTLCLVGAAFQPSVNAADHTGKPSDNGGLGARGGEGDGEIKCSLWREKMEGP